MSFCCSVAQLCPALCDPVDCSMPGFPDHLHLQELAQTHVHWVMPSNQLALCRPLLFLPSIFPSISLFQWISTSHQVVKVLELQLQHQSFQWIFRTDFLEDWLVWPPCSPGDSQVSSPTPQFKNINSSALSFMFQLSHPNMTIGKNISLTVQTFVSKVTSLLFNTLLD